MPQPDKGNDVGPFPASRKPVLDVLHLATRQADIHRLLEVDVTEARQTIREHAVRTGERPSFTASVIAVARAVT